MSVETGAPVRPPRLRSLRGWVRSLPGIGRLWRYFKCRIRGWDGPPVQLPTPNGFEPWMELFALPDYQLFVDRSDGHIGKAVAGGGYEPHVTTVLRRLLQRGHGFSTSAPTSVFMHCRPPGASAQPAG
ncbi:MAG TPA: hypothetical protein VMS17_12200 [Gemmataceae bacterium]|nr:hypothetical protein [Gemmataceae bacterium]